ncbi:hypothetical protein [Sphingomonas sp.]|uniref:hypothetical protein n=1 Tax=Sphingomonas sp. TaxID=28214 RepID=UPI003B00F557
MAAVLVTMLAGCAAGRGDQAEPPVGHAARARHGAEPLARPPEDAGGAEDPKTS